MCFVTKLTTWFKSKSTKIEDTATTNKEETSSPVEKTVNESVQVIEPTRQVQIINVDNFKFDKEGLPIIESSSSDDIHTITKKSFTPTKIYTEPGFLPWSEQLRYKNEPQVNPTITIVHNSNSQVQQVITNSVPLHTPNSNGLMVVYNGYPLSIQTANGAKIIAINNRGDIEVNINDNVDIYDGTNTVLFNGKILEVLDCNEYTRGKIRELQGEVYYI